MLAASQHLVVSGLLQVVAGVATAFFIASITYLVRLGRKAANDAAKAKDSAFDAKVAAAANAFLQHEHEQVLEHVATEVADVKHQVCPNGGETNSVGDITARIEREVQDLTAAFGEHRRAFADYVTADALIAAAVASLAALLPVQMAAKKATTAKKR